MAAPVFTHRLVALNQMNLRIPEKGLLFPEYAEGLRKELLHIPVLRRGRSVDGDDQGGDAPLLAVLVFLD